MMKQITDDLRGKLQGWAATKPTIKALYVFGSYASGVAQPGSDLDLAFEFFPYPVRAGRAPLI